MTIHFAANPKRKAEVAELILNNPNPLCVEINEGDIRTLKSNSRYWAGVVTATQAHYERLGAKYTKEAINLMFKVEVFGKKVIEMNGKVYEMEPRSRKMSQKQFNRLSEQAEVIAIRDIGVDPAEIDHHAQAGVDL